MKFNYTLYDTECFLLTVIILIVACAKCHNQTCYAECRYTECFNTECCFTRALLF